MKRVSAILQVILIVVALSHEELSNAQSPQKMSYQAVIRNSSDALITSTIVGMRISILQGSANGTVVYVETQAPATNSNGLVSIEIGSGTVVSGSLETIDWSNGPFFIQTETDPTGGDNYTISGTSQILSVPYALYAAKSNTDAKLEVVDRMGLPPDSALFAVKNSLGQTVFAVYNNGAAIYVNEGPTKGAKGGFVVGGRQSTKGDSIVNIMFVTPDSVRFILSGNGNTKGAKGGFSVGGRVPAKGSSSSDYFSVTADSTRIITNNSDGGFAVQDPTGNGASYLHITPGNMFIGKSAGQNTIGSFNSFFGHQSGMNNTTGAQNVFIGFQSGLNNILGTSNIFLGPYSGYTNTQGAYNVFVGQNSGYFNESGQDNVFVGQRSGYSNQSGNANLFIGQNSGENNFIGTHNVFLGYETGKYNISGTRNVYLGTQAGFNDSLGNYNVFLGNQAGFYEKGSNKLYIDNAGLDKTQALIYGDFGTEELRMNAKIGINSDNNGYSLNVAGDINFNGQLYQNAVPYNPGLVKVELSDNLSNPQPYTNPSIGLLVFNIGSLQPKGFYYWDGTRWYRMIAATSPSLTCDSVNNKLGTSANVYANISQDGGSAITARGFCWNTAGNPTINDFNISSGSGVGIFSSTITGLTSNITYKVRAYAQNYAGIAYSQEIPLNAGSSISLPILTTSDVTNITGTTAVTGGTVSNTGGAAVTARGVCWNTSGNATISDNLTSDGTGLGTFVSNLTSLSMGVHYYVRAYATNSEGTSYGNEISFTTPSLATLTTTSITGLLDTTALGGGNITSLGGGDISQRGICWSSSNSSPTISDAHTSDGSGGGIFSSILTGLNRKTTYYVRAYATNAAGIAYGAYVTYTTPPYAPSLTTAAISAIDSISAVSGGSISSDGGSSVTARGICWNTSSGPTISNSKTSNGTGTGSFVSNLTGLTGNTTYYVRSYATNSIGTSYGNEISFTSSPVIPKLTTIAINSITQTTASSGGSISSDGGSSISSKGVCWSTISGPTINDSKTSDGSGTASYLSSLSGLTGNTGYYVRAYATNAAGTAYGNEIHFTTNPVIPVILTNLVSNVTSTTATSGGNISSSGGATVTAYGVCWSTSHLPTLTDNKTLDGTGIGSFSSNLTGLTANTTYYVRAYATNSVGTAYGTEQSFTTTISITIGTFYQGGIVYYILQPGDPGYIVGEMHGFIAAPVDVSPMVFWWSGGPTTGATGTALGTGFSNTNIIISHFGTGNYAASLAHSQSFGGYSDWFLPSKDELNQLYVARVLVGGLLGLNYWSSSENGGSNAWYQNFSNGLQQTGSKSTIYSVRAIRAF